MKILIGILVAALITASITQAYSVDLYSLSHISTKGIVSGNSQYSGLKVWSVIRGEDATFVMPSSEAGITVIRAKVQQNENCLDLEFAVCITATVTDFKNSHKVKKGNSAEIVFILPDKQIIKILDGELENMVLELKLNSVQVKEAERIINTEMRQQDDGSIKELALQKLKDSLDLTQNRQIINALEKSNNEFENLDEAYSVIEKRDQEWIAADMEPLLPLWPL